MQYTSISGLEYLDTASGKVALGLVIKSFMENLASSTNTFAYLRTPMKEVVELPNGTATAYFDIMQIVGSANYVSGNVEVDNLEATSIAVNLDTPFIIAYSLSEIDDIRTANDFVSKMTELTQKVWTKSFNAMFLGKLFTAIQDLGTGTGAGYTNAQVVELPDILNTGLTPAQIDLMLETITDKIDDVCKVYDKFGLGAEYSNFSQILAPKVWNRFSRIISGKEVEASTDVIRNGNNIMRLAGLPTLRDDMLNNKIDHATSFSKDIDYDFTTALGVVSHSNIIGYPIKLLAPKYKLDDNFNSNIGQKAIVGFKLFRPTKLFAITNSLENFGDADFYKNA